MMSTVCCNKRTVSNAVIVFTVWGLGLLIGFLFAYASKDTFSSLMRSAVSLPVSIVSLTMHVIFLFLTFVMACRDCVLLCACFIKAVCLGFSSMLIYNVFGLSGWLVRSMFLFSDMTVCVFLLFRMLDIYRNDSRHLSLFHAVFCFALLVFDYIYLSPFLCDLF